EAAHVDVDHQSVGLKGSQGDERLEWILNGRYFEAPPQPFTNGREHARVGVDHEHLWLARAQRFGNRVAVLAEEIDDVETPEAQVPPGSAKVTNLALVCPVVDRLQIHAAEMGELACREKLGRFGVPRWSAWA